MIENNKNLNKNDVFIISPEKKPNLNLVFLFFLETGFCFSHFMIPVFDRRKVKRALMYWKLSELSRNVIISGIGVLIVKQSRKEAGGTI